MTYGPVDTPDAFSHPDVRTSAGRADTPEGIPLHLVRAHSSRCPPDADEIDRTLVRPMVEAAETLAAAIVDRLEAARRLQEEAHEMWTSLSRLQGMLRAGGCSHAVPVVAVPPDVAGTSDGAGDLGGTAENGATDPLNNIDKVGVVLGEGPPEGMTNAEIADAVEERFGRPIVRNSVSSAMHRLAERGRAHRAGERWVDGPPPAPAA